MNKESCPFDQEKDFNRAVLELEELRKEGRNVVSVKKNIWQKRLKQISGFYSKKDNFLPAFKEGGQEEEK
ncbi:MAG: hypothetical protein XD98_0160 [Microgenomates bacterium 39_6]|nr:MAG: hypothetical protein XD98_0160 [Microgenomates bacterium 39_6]